MKNSIKRKEKKHGVLGELEELSSEDKQFMMMMKNGAEFVNGHYQLSLPLRNLALIMSKNRTIVEKRADYLKKQFMKNKKFFEDYQRFMNDILQKGYARVASEAQTYSKTWYIPTMAFTIPVNLEKFEWSPIAVPSLMARQSIMNF